MCYLLDLRPSSVRLNLCSQQLQTIVTVGLLPVFSFDESTHFDLSLDELQFYSDCAVPSGYLLLQPIEHYSSPDGSVLRPDHVPLSRPLSEIEARQGSAFMWIFSKTRTATRSRRRPGNAHFISIRQMSAHAATLLRRRRY